MKEFIAVLSSLLCVSFAIIVLIIWFGEPTASKYRSSPEGRAFDKVYKKFKTKLLLNYICICEI